MRNNFNGVFKQFNAPGYQSNDYMRNNQNNNFRNNYQQPVYKRSGAKFTIITNGVKTKGMMIVNAWKASKQGLIKIIVKPYADCKQGATCDFLKAVAEVVNTSTGQMQTYPCLINITKKRVVLEQLGWLITSVGSGVTRSGKMATGSVVRLNKR